MRKILSLMLCIVLVMTLALTAFAEEADATVPQPASETDNTTSNSAPTTPATVTPEPTAPATTPTTAPAEPTVPATTPSTPEPDPTSPEPTQCTHTWDTGTGTDATCTKSGSKTFKCTLCGNTKTENTPAAGHKFGDWTSDAGKHSHTCTVCSVTESYNHVFAGCDPKCHVCGATREVTHYNNGVWVKDASGHWHACTNCNEKFDIGKHYPGPAATEEEAQLCLTCGYTLTPRLNHEHEYAEEWSSDEMGHWYACSGCEDQKSFQSHDYDDPCDSDCNICGYKNENAHSFDGSWHSDEDGHWFVCITCGGVVEAKDHIAPENVASGEAQFCTACGYMMAVAQDHTHAFGEIWMKDDASHWQECECGEKTEVTVHSWDEGTEAENGDIIYHCMACDAEYTEESSEGEKDEFPWGIVLAVLLIALVGAVIALIFVLKPKKKGKFSN